MLNSIKRVALASIVAAAATGAIAKDVVISGHDACLSTDTMTGGRVTFQLKPGTYTVSLLDNDMSCGGVNPSGGCLINSVIIRGGTSDKTSWGMDVKAGKTQQIQLSETRTFTAFVIDEPCYDNTGSATLHFEKSSPQAE